MTLIANTIHHRVPFLIGDLLFSSEAGDDSITLPTALGDIRSLLAELQYKPVKYNQKVYIIKPNLTLGLAGWECEMKDFLSEFRLKCSYYDRMTFAELMRILDDYDKEQLFKNSAFIATLVEKKDNGILAHSVVYQERNWIERTTKSFENIKACGSGALDFCYQAAEDADFTVMATATSLQRAITANVAFIAKLLTAEAITMHTVKNFWGAGFEMIYFDGEQFQKFDNLAYVIFTATFDGQIRNLVPVLVLHYHYQNDVLYYSSIRIKNHQIRQEASTTKFISGPDSHLHTLYRVKPLDLTHDLIEHPQTISFNTDLVAWGYGIISEGGIYIPSAYTDGGRISVHYTPESGVVIEIRKDFANWVEREATVVLTKLERNKG